MGITYPRCGQKLIVDQFNPKPCHEGIRPRNPCEKPNNVFHWIFDLAFILVAGDREDWVFTTKIGGVTATTQPTANVSRRSDPGRPGFERG